jgi:hypothetical protein
MRGATRAGRHHGGAVAREAGDAMDAGRLKGFGQGHRRQAGGEPPRQHRLALLLITCHCQHHHSLNLLSLDIHCQRA